MNLNPYQPTAAIASESVRGPLEKPRYSGSRRHFNGAAREEEVQKFVPLQPTPAVSSDAKPGGNGLWLVFTITALAVLFFLSGSPADPIEDSLDLPSIASSAWWDPLWVMMISLPVLVLVGLLVAVRFLQRDPWQADPPVWGTQSITFHPTYWEAEMRHRDGQPFRAQFAWSATAVLQNDNAWLLNGGFANPAMIAKGPIDEQERLAIESFFQQLVDYQQQEQIAAKLLTLDYSDELPSPAEDSAAYRFTIDQAKKKRLRLRAARHFKRQWPHLQIDFRTRYVSIGFQCAGWLMVAAGLAVALGLAFDANSPASGLVVAVLNMVLAGPALIYLGRSMRQNGKLTGQITSDRVRLMNIAVVSLIDMESYQDVLATEFPDASRADSTARVLAIASQSGGQYLFLHQDDLEVPEDFDRLCEMLQSQIATTTQSSSVGVVSSTGGNVNVL